MEEQKNPQNTNPSAGQGGSGGHHHHRSHHHHGGGQNNQNRNGGNQNPQANSATKTENQGNNPGNRPNNGQNNRPNNQQGQNAGGGKHGRHHHGHGHHNDRRPDTVQTSKDELAKLRSQIVLQSASDAPVLSDFTPAASSFAPVKKETAAEEETNMPELSNEELFSTPVSDPRKGASEKVEVVGVQFRSVGKSYYFSPKNLKLDRGTAVIVETANGLSFGEITEPNLTVPVRDTVQPLRAVVRVATKEDIQRNDDNRAREKDAMKLCSEKIAEHKLPMDLIDAQYAFDDSKLLFYFTTPEVRVDFRDLVKDLAGIFRMRIELRQIGVRDEAKLLGGIGACGRVLCCSKFLPDFAQVSIKMAKEQNLSLNAAKISGNCGRLMCCLHYESESYALESKLTPPVGSVVKTEDGEGTVVTSNPIAGTVKVAMKDAQDAPPKQYARDAVVVLQRKEHTEKPEKAKNYEKK